MTGTVLAATVNVSGGTALTFFFPVGVFVVIGTVLYLLFSRPHRRVPARPITAAGSSPAPSPAAASGGAHLTASVDAGAGAAAEAPNAADSEEGAASQADGPAAPQDGTGAGE